MQSFSSEYFAELARRLNTDPVWLEKARTLTVKITLTVTDRASSYMLDIVNGTVTPKAAKPEDPADFKFEGPADMWGKIMAGQTDFNTAVITGKMKFKGSLPKIMGIQPQMNKLVQTAKEIPAQA